MADFLHNRQDFFKQSVLKQLRKYESDGNVLISIRAKWVFSFALVDGFDNPSEYLR